MDSIEKALESLRRGDMILIHDSEDRENETDLAVAAEFVKPEHIREMRCRAGGLICMAIDNGIAESLGLPFMVDIYDAASGKYPLLHDLRAINLPYDERSSFSITINAKSTFTGIPDVDRAKTIREFSELSKNPDRRKFVECFRSPGHVPLLIAAPGLMMEREGQTESSVALARLAGLTPATVICEMLDEDKSLSKKDAVKYARENNLVFVGGSEIKRAWEDACDD
ncbi:MAG: 3,4-dihydroxy-2-butanone-4-phosphate synthase [Candidatus Altiarchaeota archaeon]